ncbi:MAG: RDD family protein [Alphaproteobacteria bacterium]|nr:RDD family protein [Alphaproteobacteria bacterium]
MAELLAPEDEADQYQLIYAGLGWRLLAMLIDGIALLILILLLSLVILMGGADPEAMSQAAVVAYYGGSAVIVWLYYATSEGGPRRASWGKWILGFRVVRIDGERLGFARASLRVACKVLTVLTLGLGFLPVLFTQRRQALHDLITGSVVARASARRP